jgi:uncharacterized protein (DUF4415 family)
MSKPNPEMPDDDVPELGDEFFQQAKPAGDIMPAEFMAKARRKGGRPRKSHPKEAVSIRLDPSVLRHPRGRGPGWQTAVNDVLADLIKRGRI